MKMSGFLKKVVFITCVCFTLTTFVYSTVMYFIYMNFEDIVYLDALRIALFFPFAFSVALSSAVVTSKSLSAPVRWILHYVFIILGFFLCIYLPAMKSVTAANAVVVLALVSALYLLSVGVWALVRGAAMKRRVKRAEPAAYSPMFKK